VRATSTRVALVQFVFVIFFFFLSFNNPLVARPEQQTASFLDTSYNILHYRYVRTTLIYPATDTDGDQHQRQQTMRANHAVFDPLFQVLIQYIIIFIDTDTLDTTRSQGYVRERFEHRRLERIHFVEPEELCCYSQLHRRHYTPPSRAQE
jgi:hypothetical protein